MVFIVRRGQVTEFLGGLFGCDIALGLGKHFVANHEFFDGGGAEQGRVEVGKALARVPRCFQWN